MTSKPTDIPFPIRVALGAARVKAAIAISPEKTTPIGIAAAHAVQQACANPGCLVRVYYKNEAEGVKLGTTIYGALSELLQIDDAATARNLLDGPTVIELTNGSGIELLPEM